MNIALDYDKTYSADPCFWQEVIRLAIRAGHDIRIVTIRDDRFDCTGPLKKIEVPIIYTRGIAKKKKMVLRALRRRFRSRYLG